MKLGANDYVTEPIDHPMLLARIEAQLARRRAKVALIRAHEALELRVQERTVKLLAANQALSREIAEP